MRGQKKPLFFDGRWATLGNIWQERPGMDSSAAVSLSFPYGGSNAFRDAPWELRRLLFLLDNGSFILKSPFFVLLPCPSANDSLEPYEKKTKRSAFR